jgi:NAD(P)H-hydrate epimerase
MATGGMGDCLTGLIVALLGQGLKPLPAAVCGVWLHATAADCEARANGVVGMLATDLFPWLRKLMDPDHE